MHLNRLIPRPPEDDALLDEHMALPRSLARERDDVLSAVLEARSRVRYALADADEAAAILADECARLARANTALLAFDTEHPASASLHDGAQSETAARVRQAAFLAGQTTPTEETGR